MGILTTKDDLFRQIKAEGLVDAFSTGFKDIDIRTGGFCRGRLYILGGRPAMGKTTLAIQMILNVLARGKKVVVFSQEMSSEMFARRLINALSKRRDLIIDVDERFETAKEWLSSRELVIDDASGLTASAISNSSNTEKADLIVIDCLQLMATESGEKTDLALGILNDLFHEIKQVSKEKNIAILGTVPASKACEMTEDKRPRLADICGCTNPDADVVMGLYREIYYDQNADDATSEILFLHNRDGARGVVTIEVV